MKRCLMIGILLLSIIPSTIAQTHANPLTSACWFTTIHNAPTFNDSLLQQPHLGMGDIPSDTSIQVLEVGDAVALIAFDHAMSAWVAILDGYLSGDCDNEAGDSYSVATATDNARLWSTPNVKTGSILATWFWL